MNKIFALAAAIVMFCMSVTVYASSSPVYTNDFEGTVGNEWSNRTTEVTPLGARRFLGQFCNDTVTLSLSDIPLHSSVAIAFDLFVIRSWDGNRVHQFYGPDVWEVSADGTTILRTTFRQSNPNDPETNNWGQAYPGQYQSGEYIAQTGATEIDMLGYWFEGVPADAVYRVNLTVPHSSESLVFAFHGAGLEGIQNESWGIDNLVVTAAIPEPSSIIAMISGFVGLGGITLRKRR